MDVGVLGATLTVPIRTAVWREDVMQRLLRTQLPEYLCLQLCVAEWSQDGRLLVEQYPTAKLIVTSAPPALKILLEFAVFPPSFFFVCFCFGLRLIGLRLIGV